MTSPILALRRAILHKAAADEELLALMGGTLRLYDEPPRSQAPVYAVFGDVQAADWSADFDKGHEQDLSIVVWSKQGSAQFALAVAECFVRLFDEADLALDGHRLVNLRVTRIAAERDKETQLGKAIVRLRAVTEVA